MDTTVTYRPFRRQFRGQRLVDTVKSVAAYARENRKVLAIVAAAAFLFYWYELRPIQMNNSCAAQAGANARALLQSKFEVAQDTQKREAYRDLVARNMYLRSDYESFYKKCLRGYGVNL